MPVRPNGKTPLIEWKQIPTKQDVHEWFKKWPNCNIGIRTGKDSNLTVIDLDGIEGIKTGIKLKLTSNVVSKTGKGKQLFYLWDENIKNAVRLMPGLDIRSENGFVVVPPSIHPNGKRYRWERFIPSTLGVLPMTLQSAIPVNSKETVFKESGWIAKALEEMKIGNIDDTLTSVCGRLRHDGYSELDARVLLGPHADLAGATKGHLEEKIRNIWSRYESKRADMLGTRTYSEGLSQHIGVSSGELSIHSPTNDDSFNRFEQIRNANGAARGLETGFKTLDKFFEGSLRSERPFVIAARTGTGKTNFGIALSFNLCKQGKKVLYFSTEFKYSKIWNWYIPYCKNIEEFRSHELYVCDSFNPNIEQIEKALIEYKPDVFIFDYIQHLGKDKDVLTNFMHGCQFLQHKYNTQAIVLAQLNRYADGRDEKGKAIEPRMSMIEGSATIEQTASRVLLLSTVTDDMEKKEIQGILDKNDEGDTGMLTFALMKHPFIFREI